MPEVKEEKVLLGSGKFFLGELENGAVPTNLFDDSNNVGSISGGAELVYTPTVYDVINDENKILKSVITNEEVNFKSGVLSWNMETMQKIALGAKYDSANKRLTIGGQKSIKQYAVGFLHEEDDYTLKIVMIGRGNKGFTLSFLKDKETIIDAEFTAIKDKDGVLVTIEEVETEA